MLLAADAQSGSPRRPDNRHIAELGHRFKEKMPRDGSWLKKQPVSDLELYRIKRAILRYEIYYALFLLQDKTWLLESQCKFFSKSTPLGGRGVGHDSPTRQKPFTVSQLTKNVPSRSRSPSAYCVWNHVDGTTTLGSI